MKLLCKKDYVYKSHGTILFEFCIGKSYEIIGIDNEFEEIILQDELTKSITFFNYKSESIRYVYDYFYAPEELRKLKLEKI